MIVPASLICLLVDSESAYQLPRSSRHFPGLLPSCFPDSVDLEDIHRHGASAELSDGESNSIVANSHRAAGELPDTIPVLPGRSVPNELTCPPSVTGSVLGVLAQRSGTQEARKGGIRAPRALNHPGDYEMKPNRAALLLPD
jgi:hypothetical protein